MGGLIGGAVAAFVLFDLRDRLRIPDLVPTGICVLLGAAAVAGAVVVSG